MKAGALLRISILAAIALLVLRAPTVAQKPQSKGKAASLATAPVPKLAFVDPRASKLLSSATAPPTVHLANISTRLPVGAGDNVLIAGFTITGSQPKRVIVRGLGPLLPVNANLADPTLELHDSLGIVAGNDNWRDTQQDELKATTIPPTNDYDSAIVQSLAPGAYTAVLAGKGATTGVGLVEVYDLDQGADSRLTNIATRGRVGEGDDVLICGTIAVGSGSTNVLFLAIGPSLSKVGVPNALQDPTLELHDGQGGVVATNDNWQDTQKDAIQGTTLAPSDPREAAILYPLTPGAYTAIVRGKNNTTGIAVIQAYQIN
ncbi:MAG: hypothetical protein M3N48_15950 [Verrucomicrobiota bacterium]|nr:hypothetical protein [Verrucomicrobiota bacterium]